MDITVPKFWSDFKSLPIDAFSLIKIYLIVLSDIGD